MPSWDNAARRNTGATILHGSTPELYQQWLTRVLRTSGHNQGTDGIVFLNAWNEWAEGNHLEPCQRWGRAYLEATRDALAAALWPEPPPSDKNSRTTAEDPHAAPYAPLIRAARADTVEILRHTREELTAATAELEAAVTEVRRLECLRLAAQELEAAIPSESDFILVNEEGSATLLKRDPRLPVSLECDGQYSGPPSDDESAIGEVEQLRRAGASFIVFGWPAFWWLECYTEFSGYLRARFPCPLENERLIVFDLRNGK
jgi:hypothetical protein